MKILKMAVKAMTGVSLMVFAVTGEVAAAICLLGFSSMSLGILIGENIDGVSE